MRKRGTRKRKPSQDEGGEGGVLEILDQSTARKTRHRARGKQEARETQEKGEGRGNQADNTKEGQGTRGKRKGRGGRTTHHRSQIVERQARTAQGEAKRGTPSKREEIKQQTTEREEGTGKREKMGREALTVLDQSTARKARYPPVTTQKKGGKGKLGQERGRDMAIGAPSAVR